MREEPMGRPIRSILATFAIVVAPAMFTGPAWAVDTQVGEVVLVLGDVRGTPAGGAGAPLGRGAAVLLDMRVETGRDSGAKMTFEPEGALTLGSNAEVLFTEAKVDTITGRSRSFFSVLVGKLRLALSPRFRGDVEIDTPTSTIGIKGTDLRLEVFANGRTVVALLEGEATVKSKIRGGEVLVKPGYLTVVEPGQAPTPPAPFDPTSGTVSPSAGGPAFTVPHENIFDDSPVDLLLDDVPVNRRPGGP